MTSALDSHTAAGPFGGYIFQLKQATLRLMQVAPNHAVCVELLDDLAVIDHVTGKVVFLEQDKYTISENSNLADGSKQLWNSLHIWLLAIEEGKIKPGETICYLVTTAHLHSGLARAIDGCKDQDSAAALVTELKTAALSTPDGVRSIALRVASQPESRLQALVQMVEVKDSATIDPLNGLVRELQKYTTMPEADLAGVRDALDGWVMNETFALWRQRQPVVLLKETFLNRLEQELKLRRREKIRELQASLALPAQAVRGYVHLTFVDQLRKAELDDEFDAAMRDFHRHQLDRAYWAESGIVLEGEVLKLYDSLVERWDMVSRRCAREGARLGWLAVQQGQMVFQGTVAVDYRPVLAGVATQEFYTMSGSYHTLANEERVKWHPDYRDGPASE